MDTIGSRIRAARKIKGLTMQQLHELTGLSTGNISDLENDRYAPSVSALIPIRRALKCSIDWLLSGEDLGAPKSEQALSCDGVELSQLEANLVAMFRLLKSSDRETTFDFVTMLYEKTTGEKGSVYLTYIEDEDKQTSGPADGGGESVIA